MRKLTLHSARVAELKYGHAAKVLREFLNLLGILGWPSFLLFLGDSVTV
jgi:hypothetical protein